MTQILSQPCEFQVSDTQIDLHPDNEGRPGSFVAVFHPTSSTKPQLSRTAVVVCPGGGYSQLYREGDHAFADSGEAEFALRGEAVARLALWAVESLSSRLHRRVLNHRYES